MKKIVIIFLVLIMLLSTGCIEEAGLSVQPATTHQPITDVPPSELVTSTAPATTPQSATNAPITTTAPPSSSGKKIVLVWMQDGVRKVTFNGVPIQTGIDNQVEIETDKPLQAIYDYTDEWGRDHTRTRDLDSYYDYFLIHRGGVASTIHRDQHESDKTATT